MGMMKRRLELKDYCEAIINSDITYNVVKGIAQQILDKGLESLSEKQLKVFENTQNEFTEASLYDPKG